jgi:hypothetical protein
MPALAERRALGILAPDVPVLSLKRPGQAEELFDARLVEIVASGPLHDEPERPMNDHTPKALRGAPPRCDMVRPGTVRATLRDDAHPVQGLRLSGGCIEGGPTSHRDR